MPTDPGPDPTTPLVYVTRPLPEPATAPLAAAGLAVRQHEPDRPPTADELRAGVADAAALVCLLTDRVDGDLLDAAPGLRVVANVAVGFDNIDVAACTERGVVATNTPGVLTEATADLAWALLLAAARRVGEGERLVRSGGWEGWSPTQLVGQPVHGRTIGIVGMGAIGTAVARRARGFGMEVLYASRSPRPEAEAGTGARRVPLDELLATADVVSLHTPLTPETRHLIDAAALARMKPTAILVNTARGPVVDEVALVEALRTGRIAAAGLDVFEREPALADGLAELDNAVVLPHLGSATTEARAAMVGLACANVVAVLAGGEPPTPLNPEVLGRG
ncbi:MAG: D-glycerate dehydrogenase [Acidimicrobiales bacterium]